MNYKLARKEYAHIMSTCETSYDDELLQIPHYVNHPEMLPFVGYNYDNKKKRILLIGESHYLTNSTNRNIFEDYSEIDWYDQPLKVADTENVFYQDYGNYVTRNILHRFVSKPNFDGSGLFIFSNPIRAYYPALPSGKIDKQHIHDFAFMNYYQRPAFVFGQSFGESDTESQFSFDDDIRISNETTTEVINILKPDIVIFFSKKGYSHFCNNTEATVYRVPHPTCQWWYRKKKNGKSGSEEFKELLQTAWN